VEQKSVNDLVIALDGMGGDNAPSSIIEGAAFALKNYPGLRFTIYGDQEKINPILVKYPGLQKSATLIHTSTVVASDAKPSVALRQARDSSMRLAIDAVKDGQAAGMVSAGNTGALMAMAKIVLRTLPGIDRPAIASLFPSLKGQIVLLDLGANVECTATNLFQFAIMGDAFARAVLGLQSPKIGLLNVGSEEVKGHEAVKAASIMLRESKASLNFYGYVEGNDIAEGTTDVVVTDGFTGNVALKTAEGTGKICKDFLRIAFNETIFSKLGALLARRSLKRLFKKIDPRMHNGAMFLGLNGIAVKSHGNADALGFANAIGVAVNLAMNGINAKIHEELIQAQNTSAATATVANPVEQG
jgi:glycerol-3-phosphate acyltransferase PlsX